MIALAQEAMALLRQIAADIARLRELAERGDGG